MRVAVIGAGVAGGVLAHRLAKEGVKVEVYERRKRGEAKVCAGGVLSRALRRLPIHPVGVKINAVRVITPWGEISYRKPGMALSCTRADLDCPLREAAEAEGAVMHYRSERNPAEMRGYDHIVDARGASLSRIIGVETHASHVRINVADDEFLFHVFTFSPAVGYGWVFPKLNGYSVGLAGEREWVVRNAPAFLREMCDAKRRRGAFIAPYTGRPVTRSDYAWLVGDRLSLTDPLNYEGISGAVFSAMALGEHLLGVRRYEEGLKPMLKWLERELWILSLLQRRPLRRLLSGHQTMRMWLKRVYSEDL
jgi:flavin-dependent dehydrogenase